STLRRTRRPGIDRDELAYLDRAVCDRLELVRPPHGVVERGGFDHVVAAELLLRLREGSVDDEPLAAAQPDLLRRRCEWRAGDERAGLTQLAAELRVHAIDLCDLLRREVGQVAWLAVEQEQVVHGCLLGSLTPLRRAGQPALDILRRSVNAPSLSRCSLRLPHLGLWTQEGQPRSQGHPSSRRTVSATQPSNSAKPRSVMPTPPGWPS